MEESLIFCSRYLHGIDSKFNQVNRNSEGAYVDSERLSVFAQTRFPLSKGKPKFLEEYERKQDQLYVLKNCEEVQPFLWYDIVFFIVLYIDPYIYCIIFLFISLYFIVNMSKVCMTLTSPIGFIREYVLVPITFNILNMKFHIIFKKQLIIIIIIMIIIIW